MKAKKFRKYEEGGLTEGPNKNIDDDTRARAMEFVRRRMSGEESDSAPSAPTPRARSKAVIVSAKTTPAKSPAPAENTMGSNEVPRPPSEGRYKQDTYETPLKSAVRRMTPEVMDNLGKIVGGLGAGYGAFKGTSKLIDAARAADKVRDTAALARSNAGLAERMRGIVGTAEKAVAEKAALAKGNAGLAERMKGVVGTAEKAATKATKTAKPTKPTRSAKPTSDSGKPIPPSKARANTNFKPEEEGVEFRKGGKVGSASRGDGCAQRGRTKGKCR